MDMVVCSVEGDGPVKDLVLLADEMLEDPGCRMVAVGHDDAGGVLVSMWREDLAAEVADGLRSSMAGSVRRLRIPDGLVGWRG